jgi:hypothetical protein
MKTLISFLFLSLFSYKLYAQQPDSLALKAIQLNLNTVSHFIDKKDTSLKKIREAIGFLNELTGIYNEFYGKYYGQFKPTDNDLKAWTRWMEMNKAYLRWDKELKAVMLFKRVRMVSE